MNAPSPVREPALFEAAMRAIAAQEAERGPCPVTGDRHAFVESQQKRLYRFGGAARCVRCQMEVRLIERGAVDLTLTLVDRARVYAGLPRFTEVQRTFLRALLGGRDPIITAIQESQRFAEIAEAETP